MLSIAKPVVFSQPLFGHLGKNLDVSKMNRDYLRIGFIFFEI